MRAASLKWTKSKKAQLIRAIRKNSRGVRMGASCIYVPLSKTVGAKLYRRKAGRDRTYELQNRAASHGLAPVAGGRFCIQCLSIDHTEGHVKANKVYGFLTERARVPGDLSMAKSEDLQDALYAIGILHTDIWSGNVGYLGKKLVCIDFDFWSCRLTKT